LEAWLGFPSFVSEKFFKPSRLEEGEVVTRFPLKNYIHQRIKGQLKLLSPSEPIIPVPDLVGLTLSNC
jgi:hypothetical protein